MVVVGVGLIGGSLALDAKRHRLVEEIIGFGRNEQNLRFAKKHGIVNRYLLDEKAAPAEYSLCWRASHRRQRTVRRRSCQDRLICSSSVHFDADTEDRRTSVEKGGDALAARGCSRRD